MNIRINLKFDSKGPAICKIRNTDAYSYFAVGLLENQKLAKHLTKTPALITVIEGTVLFVMGDQKLTLYALDTYAIPIDLEHEVLGVTKSIFTILKDK